MTTSLNYETYLQILTNKDCIQTEEQCLNAVKECGLLLEHVQNQTREVCLAAVQQNGMALKFVKNKLFHICEAAYQQNKEAYKFIYDIDYRYILKKKY